MAIMNFGGVDENVVTREEFPLEKAREILKDETIAVIGYGVQGPGQSMNLRDNGFNVIVGQRKGSKTWDKAVADGWIPGETLFEIEEACQRGTIIEYLLSDAAQIEVWPKVKKHLTAGKTLYFSHGFAITYKERTGIVPTADVDVVLVAPKGSGTSLRRMFLQGRGLNSSYAIFQDATGHAKEKVIALGIGVGGDNRQEYGSSGFLLPETVPPGISAGAWAFLPFPAVSSPHRKARSPVPAVRRLLSFSAHTGRRQNQSHPHPHRSRSSGNADPASCLGFYRDGTGSKPSRSALHGFHNAPQPVLL